MLALTGSVVWQPLIANFFATRKPGSAHEKTFQETMVIDLQTIGDSAIDSVTVLLPGFLKDIHGEGNARLQLRLLEWMLAQDFSPSLLTESRIKLIYISSTSNHSNTYNNSDNRKTA